MGFSQLDWIGLFMFGLVVGLPFILEYLRIVWVILPEDFGRGKGKRIKWYERVVWSTEWYSMMRESAGRLCPVLWSLPVVWICVWFLGATAVWFVWKNQSNYSQTTWDAFIGLQMAIAILAIWWHALFLRSENYIRSAILSAVVACIATASLGIALSGSFSGSDITPDGILYIFYAGYWIWMAIMSVSVLVAAKKTGLTQASFVSPFLPRTSAKFMPDFDLAPVSTASH